MNKKILKTLEFDQIKEQLALFLVTAQGKHKLDILEPSSDRQKVSILLDQTDQALLITRRRGGIPLEPVDDLNEIFKRIKIKATLSSTELAALEKSIRSGKKILDFFKSLEDEAWYDNIKQLLFVVDRLTDFSRLDDLLSKTVDDRGSVLDTASVQLGHIRKNKLTTENQVRSKLSAILKSSQSKYLSEKIISSRDGVLVVAVKSEFRKRFGGVIHDQSQSGLTLFTEPESVTGLNEHLHELGVQEKNEINRILAEISKSLFPYFEQLRLNDQLIGELDLIQAKARLAEQMNANKPVVSDKKIVSLINARHPVLGADAVANDIALGDGYSALIITGPNTGGKTVLMKTLGLLSLMAQSGIFITADPDSEIFVFDDIFADIGDEQSLEQSLSTFSSHMDNIKSIVENADENSLVLLDELGAGTDPGEGSALAMAIIEYFSEHKVLNLTTTHYPELKIFADQNDFAINASMEFDVKSLRPTYKLLMGIPGQSNALTISRRLGLRKEILDKAESYVDPQDQKLNELIKGLVSQRADLSAKQVSLKNSLDQAKKKNQQLELQLASIDKQANEKILEAKNEANRIIAKTKDESKKIIDQIRRERLQNGRRGGKNEQELQRLAHGLDKLRQDGSLEKNKVLKKAKYNKALKIGQDVMVTPYHQVGTIIDKISNNQWQVQLGILKVNVDQDQLERISDAESKKIHQQTQTKASTRVVKNSSKSVSGHIDLRGERYEQAMIDLDRYLDQAVLNNLGTIEIIHGKGSGALRQGVTQMLHSDRRVKSHQFANPNGAGDGATIVELR